LKEASALGKWGIGVDADEYNVAKHILTSALKQTGTGVYDTVVAAAQGHFKAGKNLVFNLNNKGVGVGKISPKVKPAWIKLMNIFYGLYRPDAGEIRLNGKPVSFSSAREAIQAGIGMVHQHFMLIPVMTVAENIVLGTEPRKGVLLDEAVADQRVADMARTFRFEGDPE